jgi:hypothetical protein
MGKLILALAASVAIFGGSSVFAAGHGGGHGGDHGGGGFSHGGGHGGGFGGGGFAGPGIGFGIAPGYYDYGYDADPGCYQLQRVWTGRRWQMRQVQVC